MDIPKNAPRSEITVQGVPLSVPAPFQEGHKVTANEAQALNQLLSENVRNNFANTVKKAKEAGDADPQKLQPQLDEYVQGYEFGARGGGGQRLDPVEREARGIASEAVRTALRGKGYSVDGENGIGKAKFKELVAQYAQKDEVRKEAQRRVDAAKAITAEDLGV